MKAASKDDAYAELRKRGVRPIKVVERIAPIVRRGFKGLRKRDVLCLALGALCLAGVAWVVAARRPPRTASARVTLSAVERMTKDPSVREELRKVVAEREALEKECRERFVKRVKSGTLSKEEANELFRAMGMEEIR